MNHQQLTEQERYQIYALYKTGMTKTSIATLLNRHPSTVCREIKRNTGGRGYRAKQAHEKALDRRINAAKAIKVTAEVKRWIILLLKQQLNPEQVAGYLLRNKGISLHHETIYQLFYVDKKAGGTVIGKGRKSALLTLVEPKTLYTMIFRLTGKQATLVAQTAVSGMKELAETIHTITLDNGLEFAHHEAIAQGLKADIYFAHPYSFWERGINENTNGLMRQYFPKGTDLNQVTDEQILQVMASLNSRPRKIWGFKTPSELFMGQSVDLLAA